MNLSLHNGEALTGGEVAGSNDHGFRLLTGYRC